MQDESVYWKEGEAYHRTALGAKNRRKVFNAEIIYNLLAMAIEKYFMAFFEKHNTMPDNHTFTDLINSANRIMPMDTQLVYDLQSLETMQDICPIFEDYQRHEPNDIQLEKLFEVTEGVFQYCREN